MNREATRIEELKCKLAMAQDDLSIRTAELERVESERDALIQNRDEWRKLAKMLAQLQFDEFHAGGEALIDQHNAARELYKRLSEVER